MSLFAAAGALLAEFAWDPQVRGIVIVLVSVVILCGSVYLLLGTNVGARLGFMLSVAGLSGWCVLLGVLWVIGAGGLIGRSPSWKPMEIALGPPGAAITEGTNGLPPQVGGQPVDGWRVLPAGDPVLGDATAAADKMFAPDTTLLHGEPPPPPKFTPPYSSPSQYVQVASYVQGGREAGVWFRIKNHRFYKQGPWYNPVGWFRAPAHRVVITVQKAAPKIDPNDLTEKPRADLSAPQHTLVLVRDRGSIRFPPFMWTVFWGVVFAVSSWALHQRDKELMAKKAGAGARPATA